VGEGRQDLNLLRHALGKLGDTAARELAEAHHLQQLIGAGLGITIGHAFETRKIGDDLARTHFLVETALFRQEADALQ